MTKLDIKFNDSMISERWVAESLALLAYTLPSLKQLTFAAQANLICSKPDSNPDYALKLDREGLLKPHAANNPRLQTMDWQSPLEYLTINLADNAIHDAFMGVLTRNLRGLTALKQLRLDLSYNLFSDAALKLLLESLHSLTLS